MLKLGLHYIRKLIIQDNIYRLTKSKIFAMYLVGEGIVNEEFCFYVATKYIIFMGTIWQFILLQKINSKVMIV